MAQAKQLSVHLTFPIGHERAAALACQAQMKADELDALEQFAAELVALRESRAAGRRMVVCDANEIGATLTALRLTGREN
jgi:hypothetical protein